MRERLLKLFPEIGVPSVPGVPKPGKSYKSFITSKDVNDTPMLEHNVTDVPAFDELLHPVHPVHPKKNEMCQEKTNKINIGTPGTPVTPAFSQNFIETWEERAAIMEFDSGMTRQDAEAAAKRDTKC